MADTTAALSKCSENQQTMLLSLSWAIVSVAVLAVSGRLYFRLGLRNGIRADDYTIIASLVAAIIGTAFLTKLIDAGVGRHLYCLPPEQIPIVIRWSIMAQIVNVIGIGLVKVSVILCVLRLIDRAREQLNVFLWILVGFVSASHLAQVLLFLVQCRPMAAIWNPHVHGKCFSPHVTYLAGYIGFGLDAFTDIACAGIPIFVIHRLQLNRQTKVALYYVMGLGALTASCAIAKAVFLKELFSNDYTWTIVKPAICTVLEHLLGIVIACVPALKPLFSRRLYANTSTGNSSRRSFRQLLNSGGSTPPPGAVAGDRTGDNVQRIPLDDKSITKTTDVYFSTEQYLDMGDHGNSTPSWFMPNFPAPPPPPPTPPPPPPAKKKHRMSIV